MDYAFVGSGLTDFMCRNHREILSKTNKLQKNTDFCRTNRVFVLQNGLKNKINKIPSMKKDLYEDGDLTILPSDNNQSNHSSAKPGENFITSDSFSNPVEFLFDDDEEMMNSSNSFQIVKRPETKGVKKAAVNSEMKQFLDLGALDSAAREKSELWENVIDISYETDADLFSKVPFEALIIQPSIVRTLKMDMNIRVATVVQNAVIPRILERKDVVFQSHTGSGKTLAFVLPLMEDVETAVSKVQSVIVAPSRELAMQITDDIRKLCDDTDIRVMPIIGGANHSRQVDKLRKNKPHIVVGTPGRLKDLTMGRRPILSLSSVQSVVVDEVDQCVGLGFREELEAFLEKCPRNRQLIFSSATSDSPSVRDFAVKWMKQPLLIRIACDSRLPASIEHLYTVVKRNQRLDVLRRAMYSDPIPKSAICFVEDQRRVDVVWEKTQEFGIPSVPLRGNADKIERENVLRAFRKGDFSLLIATEVAARGLDLPEVSLILNLDLPTDADHYVHRAGRCGRAGRAGRVVSIATAETKFVVEKFARALKIPIQSVALRQGQFVEYDPDTTIVDQTGLEKPINTTASVGVQDRKRKDRLAVKKNKGKPEFARRSTTGFDSDLSGVGPASSNKFRSNKREDFKERTDRKEWKSDKVFKESRQEKRIFENKWKKLDVPELNANSKEMKKSESSLNTKPEPDRVTEEMDLALNKFTPKSDDPSEYRSVLFQRWDYAKQDHEPVANAATNQNNTSSKKKPSATNGGRRSKKIAKRAVSERWVGNR